MDDIQVGLEDPAWYEHHSRWRHCLRCKLCNWRLSSDKDRAKHPSAVPLAMDGDQLADAMSGRREALSRRPKRVQVVFLLPCPDEEQEAAGDLAGLGSNPEAYAPSVWDLAVILRSIRDKQPIPFSKMGFCTALGCRPVNYTDTRKLLAATKTMLTPCAPRWHTEVALMAPQMIMTLGPAAFAALGYGTTAKSYSKYLGEVVSVDIGGVSTPVYVGPDVHSMSFNATEEMWSEPFGWEPTSTPVRAPVADMRWHVWRALLLAEADRTARVSPEFQEMALALDRFYSRLESPDSNVASLVERVSQWSALDMGAQGVRWDLAQKPSTDLEEVDDSDDLSDADEDDYASDYSEDDHNTVGVGEDADTLLMEDD